MCPSAEWPFSSCTRNMALGSDSVMVPSSTMASSFAMLTHFVWGIVIGPTRLTRDRPESNPRRPSTTPPGCSSRLARSQAWTCPRCRATRNRPRSPRPDRNADSADAGDRHPGRRCGSLRSGSGPLSAPRSYRYVSSPSGEVAGCKLAMTVNLLRPVEIGRMAPCLSTNPGGHRFGSAGLPAGRPGSAIRPCNAMGPGLVGPGPID
jgi:hypothetical protein